MKRELGVSLSPISYAGATSYFLNISSYFPHILYIFSTYFFIFSTYFLLFLSYLLHQGIPECDVFRGDVRRGGRRVVHSRILNLPPGPGLEIFPSPPDIFSHGHIERGRGGRGILANPDITYWGINHETYQKNGYFEKKGGHGSRLIFLANGHAHRGLLVRPPLE